ncbi:MAG: MBL fold metallo-hydrolase [Candidatus Omnitrophica bacterium]|nr:MBL fold metallo-hydrolase [Candidatus Omnitrophota bacterium]
MVINRLVVGPLQTNCYIVSTKKKDAFIIDPGDEADTIRKFIQDQKLKVHFIINTHSHIDHIKADCELDFPIYIHKLDVPALENPKKSYSFYLLGEFNACKPARILYDGDKIKFDNLDIEIMHTPGHSPGGICLKIDQVVFTGDTLFRDGIGRTDLPDGSYESIMSSIKNRLLCLDDNIKIYPGHGEASTIGRERANF